MSCAPDKLPLVTELWSPANVPVLVSDCGAFQTGSHEHCTNLTDASIAV